MELLVYLGEEIYEKKNNIKLALKDYKQTINLDADHILAKQALKNLNNIQ